MAFLLAALAATFLVTLLLVRFENAHRAFTADPSAGHAHKFHVDSVTRVGGVGVLAGLLISWSFRLFDDVTIAKQGLLLVACAIPTFAAGLLEDVSKRGWVRTRFLATLISPLLAGELLGGWIIRLDLPGLDGVLAVPIASVIFTCIAVAGVTHAFNLVDGFNGLATGVATIILLALAYVAFKVGDVLIFAASLTGVGAVVGFMLWNFPRGLIYLGDCGAYLLGFWVAELSVLLVVRNPQVSAWFPLVLCAYPVFETLFSIYRRVALRGAHPTRPDAAHLHHMIYRRVVRWALGAQSTVQHNRRNAMTSPYLWLLTSVGVMPAVLFWRYTWALQLCAALFGTIYVYGYLRIIKFRAPRWWVIQREGMMFPQRAFFSRLSEVALIALVVATPIAMSGAMNRGYEISKLAVAEPLAMLALGGVLCAGAWVNILKSRGLLLAPGILIGGFLLVGCVSTLMSETPEAAWWGSYYRREGLLAWCAYAAVFFSVLAALRRASIRDQFVDALLIASVVPCIYAIQQRYGLDFYFVANIDTSRPNGTLGNPIFLAAYLALLLPLTAARGWQARGNFAECALWGGLGALQLCSLLMTQSRGPLLALFAGLVLLAACIAAHTKKRLLLLIGIGVFGMGCAGLVVINSVTGATRWASGTPVLSRLVLASDSATSVATTLAARSTSTRLGIWQAGNATFAAAPFANQLVGYGPESAYVHYFPHMPASVMRAEGYFESNSFDRLHAEALDIGLNFGVFGWLAYALSMALVIYAAARSLFGFTGYASFGIFAGFTIWGGAFAAVVASQIGLRSAVVPAFGLGMGGGWFLFVLGAAWRAAASSAPRGNQEVPLPLGTQWPLQAALMCALLIFWIDAQVNIPMMTTRLISFALAALILLLAGAVDEVDQERGARASAIFVDSAVRSGIPPAANVAWIVAFGCVVAAASFLAPIYVNSATGRWDYKLSLRVLPMFGMLCVGAYAAWVFMREASPGTKWGFKRLLIVAVVPPAIYAGLHYVLAVDISASLTMDSTLRLSVVSMAGSCFVLGLCLLRSWLDTRVSKIAQHDRATVGTLRSADFFMIPVAIAMLAGTLYGAWTAISADVASTAATWVENRQKPELVDPLIEQAVYLMPYERQYRRQWMQRPAVLATAELQKTRGAAASFADVKRALALAGTRAQDNSTRWPQDPWFVFSQANYLQLRALRVLREHDAPGGAKAAEDARKLFERAHQMLPTQPLFLRNWAQLEAEEGNVGDAADLLARMEAIIPGEIEPYSERIALAQRVNDTVDVQATLVRAKRNLSIKDYSQLETVAKTQHKGEYSSK